MAALRWWCRGARPATARTLLFLALAAGAGCGPSGAPTSAGSGKPKTDLPPVHVTLAPVTTREAIRTVDVTGTLNGDEEATISSKLPGRVATIAVDLGDEVAPGDILATIESRDYQLERAQRVAARQATLAQLGLEAIPSSDFDASTVPSVRQRQSEADNARAKFDRATKLFEAQPPLISEQDLADLRTAWQVARDAAQAELLSAKALIAKAKAEDAAVEASDQKLRDVEVRAPAADAAANGASRHYRVAQRLVSSGEYMRDGQAMFRLVAVDPIRFKASVPERFASAVAVGQSCTVHVEAYDAPFVGQVTRIAPRVDDRSRAFDVEIRLPNTDARLKPGSFARGAIAVRREENVTFVPEAALVTFAGVDRVYSVADGKAREHRVRPGLRIDGLVEVIGKVDAAEVIVGGVNGIAPGVAVVVDKAKAEK